MSEHYDTDTAPKSYHRGYVVGLTGPIASGKSTVAGMLAQRGAELIDADRVYHELLRSGTPLWQSVVDRFGHEIVRDDGEIDRAVLGDIVFDDPRSLADLERLTHPSVVSEIRARVRNSSAAVIAIEAIKLAQAGLLDIVDELWLVVADPEVRIQRLMNRSGLEHSTARARVLASSNPLPAGVEVDAIIDNSGDLAQTRHTVDAAWNRLLESERPNAFLQKHA